MSAKPHEPDLGTYQPLTYFQLMEVSLRELLVEKGVISEAEVARAMAEIGAHFSVGAVTNYGNITNGYWGVLPVVPQVVNPSTNILLATNSWMLISGTFVAAGGEDHVTIGNFLSDPATT